MFFKDTVTITDPELVEHLVDRLALSPGYSKVVIGDAQNTFFKRLHNREIREHVLGGRIQVDDCCRGHL